MFKNIMVVYANIRNSFSSHVSIIQQFTQLSNISTRRHLPNFPHTLFSQRTAGLSPFLSLSGSVEVHQLTEEDKKILKSLGYM
jgi:hypothetical protein